MLGHSGFHVLAAFSLAPPLPMALAYVGLGPGQELIPFFFALLGVVGTAIVAILQWPISVVLRRLRIRTGARPGLHVRSPLAAEPEKTVDCLPDNR